MFEAGDLGPFWIVPFHFALTSGNGLSGCVTLGFRCVLCCGEVLARARRHRGENEASGDSAQEFSGMCNRGVQVHGDFLTRGYAQLATKKAIRRSALHPFQARHLNPFQARQKSGYEPLMIFLENLRRRHGQGRYQMSFVPVYAKVQRIDRIVNSRDGLAAIPLGPEKIELPRFKLHDEGTLGREGIGPGFASKGDSTRFTPVQEIFRGAAVDRPKLVGEGGVITMPAVPYPQNHGVSRVVSKTFREKSRLAAWINAFPLEHLAIRTRCHPNLFPVAVEEVKESVVPKDIRRLQPTRCFSNSRIGSHRDSQWLPIAISQRPTFPTIKQTGFALLACTPNTGPKLPSAIACFPDRKIDWLLVRSGQFSQIRVAGNLPPVPGNPWQGSASCQQGGQP